ncbi:hypothetical protein DPMN_033050 [Dreissena polymorpha]|uniref:Uncharacterized protein n=1 Tax=Dreissena polymorpha TaxID=45954 RepID=A0A9D4M6A5_DREPO|nr:hypothetical protein DPMN_033050 [Dreissena polymorpha]
MKQTGFPITCRAKCLTHSGIVETVYCDEDNIILMDYLNPAEIFYSQDSINNRFRNGHRNTYIGDTLDDLISGNLNINNIDPMTVTQIPGLNKWVSLDNRRLWVIHHYASKRNCGRIRVKKVSYESLGFSDLRKFTADNKAGVSVQVRNGSPGGTWHNRITPLTPRCSEPQVVKEETTTIVSSQNAASAPANEQLGSIAVTTQDADQNRTKEDTKHVTWKDISDNLSKTTTSVTLSSIAFTPIDLTLSKRGEGKPNVILSSLLKPFGNKPTWRYRKELSLDRSLLGKRKASRAGLFRVRSEDEPILKRMRPSWMSRAHNGYVDVYLKPPAFHYAFNITFYENRRTRVLRVQYIEGNPWYWFDMETGRLDYFENMKPDDWISSDDDDTSADDVYAESDDTESENRKNTYDNVDDFDSKEIDYGEIEEELELDGNIGTEESDYEDMPTVFDLKNEFENSAREDKVEKDSNLSNDNEIVDEDTDNIEVEYESEAEDSVEDEYNSTDDDESEVEEELVYGLEYNWSDEDPEYLKDGKIVNFSDVNFDVNDTDEAESTDESDKDSDEDETDEETQDETEDETLYDNWTLLNRNSEDEKNEETQDETEDENLYDYWTLLNKNSPRYLW